MTMTPEQLVSCLFEPVADHLKAYIGGMSEDELRKELRPPKNDQHGFEPWFGARIREAVPHLVRSIEGIGPDLILHDETKIGLKASNNCRTRRMAGTDKSNPWQKYHNHPRHPMFGGCLFLGGFKNLSKNEDKIKKTIKGKIADIKDEANPDVVKLHDPPRYFPDPSDKHWWLLGLLLRTDWPRV